METILNERHSAAFDDPERCCNVTMKFETATQLIVHLSSGDDKVPNETPAVESPSWSADVRDTIEGKTLLTAAAVGRWCYPGDISSCDASGCVTGCVAAVAAIVLKLVTIVFAVLFDVCFFAINVAVAAVRLALSIPAVPFALLLYASKDLSRRYECYRVTMARLGDCRWCCRSSGGAKKADDRSGGPTSCCFPVVGHDGGRPADNEQDESMMDDGNVVFSIHDVADSKDKPTYPAAALSNLALLCSLPASVASCAILVVFALLLLPWVSVALIVERQLWRST